MILLAASAAWPQVQKQTVTMSAPHKAQRFVAVTIDDLPVVTSRTDPNIRSEITRKILLHLSEANVPAVGFVNENKLYKNDVRDPDQIDLLKQWLASGFELGNHTYSHKSLNSIPLADYENDVLKGEAVTRELMSGYGRPLRYFRHPYLQTGRTLDVKEQFAKFLTDHGYIIAPVTIDNGDYIFAAAYDKAFEAKNKKLMKQIGEAYVPYMESKVAYWQAQSVKLFKREMHQILLIHANSINADYLDKLLAMLERRDFGFISLEQALRDKAWEDPDKFLGAGGISWLHRWALEKGKNFVVPDEPLVPEFVLKASGFESE